MDVLKILGISLVTLLVLDLLKQHHSAFVIPVSIIVSVVITLFVIDAISPLISFVNDVSSVLSFNNLDVVFKAIAIGVLTQMTQDVCRESGYIALAGRVELAGKIGIILVGLPLFSMLFQIILELLK